MLAYLIDGMIVICLFCCCNARTFDDFWLMDNPRWNSNGISTGPIAPGDSTMMHCDAEILSLL